MTINLFSGLAIEFQPLSFQPMPSAQCAILEISLMSKKIDRPQSVTWLTVFVLIITGWQWFRLVTILRAWDLLNKPPISVSPIYLALNAVIWGGLGCALCWALFFGKPWAPTALRWLGLAFAIFLWTDRLLLQSELRSSNQSFILILTLSALAAVFWVLSQSGVRAFFGEQI